ncbi:RHS repeat domain-containing protein, partial [Flavobacterium jumunjinense]
IGTKLEKRVTSTPEATWDNPFPTPVTNKTTYLAGFQYKDNCLEFFPHAEGYVKYQYSENSYSYVFNYTDHLGNVRVSYSDIDKNGLLGSEHIQECPKQIGPTPPPCQDLYVSAILEESHYYPFGLKHEGYNSNNQQSNYNYKYNGKELQTELGLNMYDYGARNYDPAIGRWMNIDPLAEKYIDYSPYNYVLNNPVKFVDPDGMQVDNIYGLNTESGDITLLETNDDKTDTLIDTSNQEVISDDVDKGLLYDGQNIMEDGLQTRNYKGGIKLIYDISLHTHDEIGGMIYKNSKGEKYLNVLPYTHSKIEVDENGVSMIAGFSQKLDSPFFTSKDKTFSGTISIMFHTHPGHPDYPKLGYAFPSPGDYSIALDNHDLIGSKNGHSDIYKKIKYFVFGAKTETKGGKTSNVGSYRYGLGRELHSKNFNELMSN